MDDSQILSHVDHTLLKPIATINDIQKLCGEALEYKTASVCIPPSYVRACREMYGNTLNICTVIGFPLGYNTLASKLAEVDAALEDTANELDMVINLGDVKNGAFDKVGNEISAIKRRTGKKILKVIIETCYLTEEEKIKLCQLITDAGADYIKTSTGFGSAGAVIDDILLFKRHIGPNVKIKAAGGIRSREDMVEYLEAGCDRLGTSSAVSILAGKGSGSY